MTDKQYNKTTRAEISKWMQSYDWQCSITLTPANPLKYNYAIKALNRWTDNLARHTGLHLQYAGVYNTHGSVHIHLLAAASAPNNNLLNITDNQWPLINRSFPGDVKVEPIYDPQGICTYIFEVNLGHHSARFIEPHGNLMIIQGRAA